jgi:rubrerythrin
MDEAESAKAYLDAADETAYAELAETYRALASDETRHSRMLSDIIETLF